MKKRNPIRLGTVDLEDRKKLETCARQFGVAGDITRLKICYLLCLHSELSVTEIAKILKLKISTVSHSLSKLKEIQVVKNRRNQQMIYYSLINNPFTKVLRSQIL